MEKKFDHILKPFLAEKLKNHLIPVHTIFDIINEAADRYDRANTDEEIVKVLDALSQKFQEVHELAENFHYKQSAEHQRDLDRKVSDVISYLLTSDESQAYNLMQMVRDKSITLEKLRQEFPSYF